MMNDKQMCLNLLNEIGGVRLRLDSSMGEMLQKLCMLCEKFVSLSDENRNVVINAVSDRSGLNLIILGTTAAERAVDTKDSDWIRIGVLAHVIENFRKDYRENYRDLYLIDYAARAIGVVFRDICEKLLPLASLEAQMRLGQFNVSSQATKELKLNGVKVIKKNGETRFVPG